MPPIDGSVQLSLMVFVAVAAEVKCVAVVVYIGTLCVVAVDETEGFADSPTRFDAFTVNL